MSLGDTWRPPWDVQMKKFQTQNVPDITPNILKEKSKKNRSKKHKGNTFRPWVTLEDPPGDAQMKKNSNSKYARYHSQDPKRII